MKKKTVAEIESTDIFIEAHNDFIMVKRNIGGINYKIPLEDRCDLAYHDEAGNFMYHKNVFGYRPGERGERRINNIILFLPFTI